MTICSGCSCSRRDSRERVGEKGGQETGRGRGGREVEVVGREDWRRTGGGTGLETGG